MRIFCPAMVVGVPLLPAARALSPGSRTWLLRCLTAIPAESPVPEVGRVALRTRTGPRITRRPRGVAVFGGPAPGLGMPLAHAEPDAQPVKDATPTCGNLDRGGAT